MGLASLVSRPENVEGRIEREKSRKESGREDLLFVK